MSSSETTFQKAGRAPASDGSLVIPEPQPAPSETEAESLDVWGFRDTHFDVSENGHVIIRGSRYELSGKELPRFLPWVREVLEVNLDPREIHAAHYPTAVAEPILSDELRASLGSSLSPGQIDTNPETRMRHGHGHTQEEMYAIKNTQLRRVPDIDVYH